MQLPLWQVLQKPTYWASNPPSIHETHSLLLSSVYLCPFYLLFFFYLGEFKHIRSSRGITAKHAIFAGTKRAIKDQGFPFLTKQEVNGLLQAEPVRACGAHLNAIGVKLDGYNSFSCQWLSSSQAAKVAGRRLKRQKPWTRQRTHCYTCCYMYVSTEIAQWIQPTRVTTKYRHIPGWCHLTWLWTNAGQHILAVHLTLIPGEWDWGLCHHGHKLQPRWQQGSHFYNREWSGYISQIRLPAKIFH